MQRVEGQTPQPDEELRASVDAVFDDAGIEDLSTARLAFIQELASHVHPTHIKAYQDRNGAVDHSGQRSIASSWGSRELPTNFRSLKQELLITWHRSDFTNWRSIADVPSDELRKLADPLDPGSTFLTQARQDIVELAATAHHFDRLEELCRRSGEDEETFIKEHLVIVPNQVGRHLDEILFLDSNEVEDING